MAGSGRKKAGNGGAAAARGADEAPAGEGRRATVYEEIRRAIRAGELVPGSRVRESEIAARLGVSRTPVREAVLRLEQDGLLTYAPRQGLTVAALGYQAVIELYAMREVLEGTAARFAASHASLVEVETLREMLEAERGLPAGDAARASALNRQFHQVIYYAAHNRFLLKSLNALADSMMLLGESTLAVPGRHDTALEEHDAVVAAIAARDPDAAERAARAHIRAAQRHRLKMIIAAGEAPEGGASGAG